MFRSSLERFPELRSWNDQIDLEARRQRRIEAAFDRADDYSRRGDDERALDWLDRAAALSGGLSPVYRVERSRLARRLSRAR